MERAASAQPLCPSSLRLLSLYAHRPFLRVSAVDARADRAFWSATAHELRLRGSVGTLAADGEPCRFQFVSVRGGGVAAGTWVLSSSPSPQRRWDEAFAGLGTRTAASARRPRAAVSLFWSLLAAGATLQIGDR